MGARRRADHLRADAPPGTSQTRDARSRSQYRSQVDAEAQLRGEAAQGLQWIGFQHRALGRPHPARGQVGDAAHRVDERPTSPHIPGQRIDGEVRAAGRPRWSGRSSAKSTKPRGCRGADHARWGSPHAGSPRADRAPGKVAREVDYPVARRVPVTTGRSSSKSYRPAYEVSGRPWRWRSRRVTAQGISAATLEHAPSVMRVGSSAVIGIHR